MLSVLLAAVAAIALADTSAHSLPHRASPAAVVVGAPRPDSIARPTDVAVRGEGLASPTAAGPRRAGSPFALDGAAVADTTRPRRVAIEYSDWYAKRLTVHRIASYAMLPLFGVEYALGQKLLDNSTPSTRNQHSLAAGAVAALFGVNTITGAWNWWDARHDEIGRTRRTVHTVLMLAADAGFVATGVLASSASNSHDKALTHRNVALGSMGIATLGTALMWFWKD